MPGATDEELNTLLLRQIDQLRGLCGRHRHRLFDEYMLAQSQSSVSVIVMAVWAAAHDHCLEPLNRQQIFNRHASRGHSEIVSDLPRPGRIALLDCNKFCGGMCEQRRNMGIGSPPPRSDYAALDSFWHETYLDYIQTIPTMPIRDQRCMPPSSTWTSRNEGCFSCNGKLPMDSFCAKRNRDIWPGLARR